MSHPHDADFRFCPRCGGRLERRRLKAGDPDRLVCAACHEVLYLDPKVAVGTIIRDEAGRILLLQRAIDPGVGRWVFPGGYVDRGEPLEDAARREAREECGLDIRLDGLVDIYSYRGLTPIVIVYAATYVAGGLALDEESRDARWFERPAIPWDDLAFPSTRQALDAYLRGRIYPLSAGGA